MSDTGILKAAECSECGGERCLITQRDYVVYYVCPDCGLDDHDSYEDLYGCMIVPWGFLL